MDPADPHAPTEYAGPERRQRTRDCEAGETALRMLVGDGREVGVFEQLRGLQALVSELRTSARLVVVFAGVIAVCTVWSLVHQ